MIEKPLGFNGALVTGGCGFIGSHIVDMLVSCGVKVTVLDSLVNGKIDNVKHLLDFRNLVLIRRDVRDKNLLRGLKDIDIIFHEAALIDVEESMVYPMKYYESNVTGTVNLLESARRTDVERVVFASSSSVYGETSIMPLREDAELHPMSPYALTKLIGEKYCLLYSELYGVKSIILRYFNVYGPRQDPTNPYAGVIPKFIWRVKNRHPPEIYGDGKQTRDFIHVSDVAQANLLAATCDDAIGKIFNIGTGKAISILELASIIIEKFGELPIAPMFSEARKGDVRHNYADITMAERILDFHPKIDIVEGIQYAL